MRNRGIKETCKSFPEFQPKFYLQAIYIQLGLLLLSIFFILNGLCVPSSTLIPHCIYSQLSWLSPASILAGWTSFTGFTFFVSVFIITVDLSLSIQLLSGLSRLEVSLSDMELQATPKEVSLWLYIMLYTLFHWGYSIQVGFCLLDRDITLAACNGLRDLCLRPLLACPHGECAHQGKCFARLVLAFALFQTFEEIKSKHWG